jgi:threonyl-tRNA synthetase
MNLPDFHVVCKDENDAKDWLIKVHDKIMDEVRALNRDYELLINLSSQKAYEDNKELILELLKKESKDGLIHIYPEGKNFYWTLNIEDVIIDDSKRPREIATVQIDIGNAKRFNITYTNEKGEKRFPVILHTALIGTIERYLYMVLDTAVAMETDKKPGYIPLWLNPEQVRFLTVKDEHYEKATELADVLASNNMRVGIDERALTISKKVKEAKQDWVGYVAVIGNKELKGDTLKVYDREKNADVEMTLEDLISQIRLKMAGKPFRSVYFPRDMGKRPS